MTTSRILFIGGTGTISSACVARAVAVGHDVTVLNRGGTSAKRPLPDGGVRKVVADIRDASAARAAIDAAEREGGAFDVVADFVAFAPDHLETDFELFEGRVGQYVFISSASAYQTPALASARDRVDAAPQPVLAILARQDRVRGPPRRRLPRPRLPRDDRAPVAHVRPHPPAHPRSWTDIARMRAGKPVVVHGDGTSLWTVTDARDFAVAFVGLLHNPVAVGDVFHITSDHAPTWNQIYGWLGAAAGVEPELVHVASDTIAAVHPEWGGPGLIGDKSNSMVFDNSKVKALVPEFETTVTFDRAAREIIEWYDAHPEAQIVDPVADAAFERILALSAPVAE